MRFVVIGAGAIGCLVAARLHRSGQEVALVARPPVVKAVAQDGVVISSPDGTSRTMVPAHETVIAAHPAPTDLVVLAVKCQDAWTALQPLLQAYPDRGNRLLILANGLEADRTALRLFPRVLGACVMAPASYDGLGRVRAHCAPVPGVIDLGCFPAGADTTSRQVSASLREAGFASRVRADIERWKWGKLLVNVANAVEAVCGPSARGGLLERTARAEARACLVAAGVAYVPMGWIRARERANIPDIERLRERSAGGSTWQSLKRQSGTVETDFLNGEVVLLGRLHGVPVPANEALQRLAAELSLAKALPGTVPEAQVLETAARIQDRGAR